MSGPDWSPAGLTAAAGADPWELALRLTDARPEAVAHLGELLDARARDAAEVARSGARADAAVATGYVLDGHPVFDAPESARQGRLLLSSDGEDLATAAAVFTRAAADLGAARTSIDGHLQSITRGVDEVIAERNAFLAARPGLLPEDLDAADRAFHARAAGVVRAGAGAVQRALDGYDEQLVHHTRRLAAIPHPPDTPLPSGSAAAGPLAVAGAAGAGVANGLVSFGNAVVNNPLETLALLGGVALAGVSAAGVVGGSLATSTGAGAPAGIPLTGLSAAGVATGGAIAATAGAAILSDALGPDRVAPLPNPFGDTAPPVTAPTMIDGAGNEWDRNGTWEALPNARPRGEDIAHTPTSRTHIPYGQEYPNGAIGGGHLWDSGVPDKTVFPEDWDTPDILERALDVARNPDHPPSLHEQTIRGDTVERWITRGTREGVDIEVVLSDKGQIVTAYPRGGQGVGVNDENGDPRLLDDQ